MSVPTIGVVDAHGVVGAVLARQREDHTVPTDAEVAVTQLTHRHWHTHTHTHTHTETLAHKG
jgi:uncharacterized protein GlcG (DUF336 family)